MLWKGFVYQQHCSYLTELFNHRPQSKGLEQTSLGAYIFSPNVVYETLRLINLGFCKPTSL